jgi:hypothetical protein
MISIIGLKPLQAIKIFINLNLNTMHVFRTPKQLKQLNNKLNQQINKLNQQIANCNCPHTQAQLQHQLMQLITKQAML